MTTTAYDGETLAGEIYEFICDRLSGVPGDDPIRQVMVEVLPTFAEAFGFDSQAAPQSPGIEIGDDTLAMLRREVRQHLRLAADALEHAQAEEDLEEALTRIRALDALRRHLVVDADAYHPRVVRDATKLVVESIRDQICDERHDVETIRSLLADFDTYTTLVEEADQWHR